MVLSIGLCLAGVFLGFRWNVLILIPVTAGILIVFAIVALISGTNAHEAITTIILPIVAVQAGYVLGIASRDAFGHRIAKPAATLPSTCE